MAPSSSAQSIVLDYKSLCCSLCVLQFDIIIIINTINMEHWTEIDFFFYFFYLLFVADLFHFTQVLHILLIMFMFHSKRYTVNVVFIVMFFSFHRCLCALLFIHFGAWNFFFFSHSLTLAIELGRTAHTIWNNKKSILFLHLFRVRIVYYLKSEVQAIFWPCSIRAIFVAFDLMKI